MTTTVIIYLPDAIIGDVFHYQYMVWQEAVNNGRLAVCQTADVIHLPSAAQHLYNFSL